MYKSSEDKTLSPDGKEFIIFVTPEWMEKSKRQSLFDTKRQSLFDVVRTCVDRPNVYIHRISFKQGQEFCFVCSKGGRKNQTRKSTIIIYIDYITCAGPMINELERLGIQSIAYYCEMDVKSCRVPPNGNQVKYHAVMHICIWVGY